MYKAIRIKSWSLEPEIIEVNFETFMSSDVEWVRPIPGVTGYESANLKKIVNDYLKKPVFSRWVACAGTLNKYDRLEIPMSEIIKWVEKIGRIETRREYDYLKEVIWNDS